MGDRSQTTLLEILVVVLTESDYYSNRAKVRDGDYGWMEFH